MGYEDDKPRITDLVDDPPSLTLFWWISGGLITLLNFALCGYLVDLHSKSPASKRRKFALRLILAIPVFSSYAYVTLYFVKGVDIMLLIPKWYQGILMYSFYSWIMTWFAKPYTPIIEQPPSDYFVTVPCCCLGLCCCPTTSISPRYIKLVKYGMIQLGFSQMVLAVIGIVLDVNGKYDGGAYIFIRILALISMLLAIYSMRSLVRMTENLLPTQNLFAKSRGLLFLISLVNIQELIFTVLGNENAYSDTDGYDSETKAQMWCSWLVLVDAFIYSLAMIRTWKPEDSSHEDHFAYHTMA